jgi:hypothetical protein
MDIATRISLHGFCRNHDLAKSTVYDRCKEIGIATSDGLSPDDCTRLRHEFNLKPSAPEPTATPVQATVETGNHYLVLSTPQLPQTYSLEGLRQSDAIGFEDPLALAAKFLQDADLVQVAMQQDIALRQQRLTQTQQAKDAIASKTQQLQLEARLYQLQAGHLDTALTNETQALTEQMQQLNRMGKPADGGAVPS